MSGHSKWSNIKRTKEKSDAQKGKVFTKIGREIAVCVKNGGADPNTNSKLKDLITKAKQSNMPNDTITRSIKKASGELGDINYEEIMYEGYGIGGAAVMVRCLTDNKNRTAGDVRHAFDKYAGSLGATGCVQFMFDQKGMVVVNKTETLTEDDLMLIAIDAGADDVQENDDSFEVYTEVSNLANLTKAIEDAGLSIITSETTWIPQNYVDLEMSKQNTFNSMIEKLEDSDDVQEVIHNVNLDE